MTNEINSSVSNTEESIAKLQTYMDMSFEIPNVVSFIRPKNLHAHLEEVKAAVVKDLKAARKITDEKEQILEDARKEAELLLLETKRQIEQQDIVKQAQIYAKQIVQEAQNQAQALLNEGQEVQQQLIINSHKYVDQLFEQVHVHLRDKMDKISENREELNASLEERMRKMEQMS